MTGKVDKSKLSVFLLVCFFISFFSWFTLRKFEHGLWCGFDQATYSQIMWNTIHGKFFWCSFTGTEGLCDLGIHMQLLLLALAPIYAILPYPQTLSIIQVVFLAIAAIPLYWIAKDKLSRKIAVLFVILYLSNNFVIQAIIEGFQGRTLSVPLIFFAFYFLIKRKYSMFSLFALLLCLSHEISSLIVFMLGIYILLKRRKVLLGTIVAGLSLGWFIFIIKFLQPYFGISEPLSALHFRADGKEITSAIEIILYCLMHPAEIFLRVFSADKMDYFVRLFAPLGFLSLLSPKELLIGIPIFIQNFLLSSHLVKVEVPRYTMAMVPIIFISAIYSLSFIYKKVTPNKKRYILFFVIVCWLFSTYKFIWDPTYNPRFQQVLAPVPQEIRTHRESLREIAALIPPDASVSADINGFPFLANRYRLYDMPFHTEEAEYILIDKKMPRFSPKPSGTKKEYLKTTHRILNSQDYEIIDEQDNIVLLKNKKAKN